MPVIGRFSLMLPVEPKKRAAPKEKIPPSDATIQHPDGGAAAVVPTAAAPPPLAWTAPFAAPATKGRTAASVVVRDRARTMCPPGRLVALRVERGGEDDGLRRRVVAQRADERLAGEVEDPAVGRHHQVAVAVADHPHHRLVEPGGAHRSLEGGGAEGE